MRKTALIIYIILSLAFALTLVSWLTWNNSCSDYPMIEGRSYSSMCVGDGVQFVGVFVFSLVAAVIYLGITALVLKLLGYKLTKK